jgi:hypothetical protein
MPKATAEETGELGKCKAWTKSDNILGEPAERSYSEVNSGIDEPRSVHSSGRTRSIGPALNNPAQW